MPTRTELMSPAGYWPQLNAAIEAGADAVYFGLKHFSARAKVGFELRELPDVMRTLHRRSVKGYITFNTLIFDHEILAAEKAIGELARCGVDAVIVQDVGIAKLIRDIAPDLNIHGSTQMSISSAEGAELAKSFGCSRVVLARELSLPDIRKIIAGTDVEVETFVHGALCVSYSGQCFSSEAWGGRSANRGQCAQACRLSYDLIVDGEHRELGAARYLLSPGDLMALDHVAELVESGVACLKIEGRYKDAEYVAITTAAYRRALDDAFAKQPLSVTREERLDLEQIYSRGLGPFFMSGTDHQKVVVGRAPRHRGVLVGKVAKVLRDSVIVENARDISRGEGLVFDAADRRSPDEPEQGGFVFDVQPDGENRVRLWFAKEGIDLGDIREGDLVWRTLDPKLEKKLKPILAAAEPLRTHPVDLEVRLEVGQPLQLTAKFLQSISASAQSSTPLEAAAKNPADETTLRKQLDRFGGTPFHLGALTILGTDSVFVPSSVLNPVRRELVQKLEASLVEPKVVEFTPKAKQHLLALAARETQINDPAPPDLIEIHALVRTMEQLDAAIESRPASITLDYLELYGLRTSVERIHAAGIRCRVASPRILKPTEQNVTKFLLSLETDILVRSGGLLQDMIQTETKDRPTLDGDFSLNVANVFSAEAFFDLGISRINPTHDLNAQQIIELANQLDVNRLEVTVLHHLPIFHMEHCVFCRFLSSGTDNTNCGHPCEKHRLSVRDAQGREHPVMADVGCRNTVFNAELQSAAGYLDQFRAAGLRHFRLEFVHQSAAQVQGCLESARKYFAGRFELEDVERVWQSATPFGTTEGSLFVPRDYRKLVQLGTAN